MEAQCETIEHSARGSPHTATPQVLNQEIKMVDGKCKHCGDRIGKVGCEICDKAILDQCHECHMEIAHGEIKCQNIHIVGGSGGKLDSVDAAPDAFKPAWKSA